MKRHQPPYSPRDPERGSVTIIVAAMATMLFAMAAMSIDVSTWYLARRNMQNVADAAVMAGLPSLGSNASTAVSRATSILTANGYGSVTPSTSSSGGLRYLTVSITASQPSYLAKIFGVSSKTMTVSAQGQSTVSSPAIMAIGTNCFGVQFSGNGFTINGDIESNSEVKLNATGTINGSVDYNPACTGANGYANTGTTITGSLTTGGGSAASPFSYTSGSFSCTSSTVGDLPLNWPVPDGVYCATGNISFSASGITGVTARITLVAGGQITFSASTLNQISANQNGIIAYSSYTNNDCNTQAINIGSGSVVMNGSFYAPNGCINASGNSMTYNGSIIGKMVQMGIGSSSTVTGASGGAATYSLYQ